MARIGLPQLPRRVQEHVFQKYGREVAAPTYRRCFNGAVDNTFPAEFAGNRWFTDDSEGTLDKVAIATGVIDADTVARHKPRRSTSRRAATADQREPVAA